MKPKEMNRWMLWNLAPEPSLLILVVDDSHDNELTAAIAREDIVPSSNFGGVWGTGQMDGNWLIAFRLIELGGGLDREWFTSNIHRSLLEAVVEVPHLVAIVPKEIAGDATTAESIALRLGGSMVVQVDDRSEAVAEVLAERDDD
jgi:hypothetical protein